MMGVIPGKEISPENESIIYSSGDSLDHSSNENDNNPMQAHRSSLSIDRVFFIL